MDSFVLTAAFALADKATAAGWHLAAAPLLLLTQLLLYTRIEKLCLCLC